MRFIELVCELAGRCKLQPASNEEMETLRKRELSAATAAYTTLRKINMSTNSDPFVESGTWSRYT